MKCRRPGKVGREKVRYSLRRLHIIRISQYTILFEFNEATRTIVRARLDSLAL